MTKFSNKLSDAEAERLALLAEECGEVTQAVGKILRHGYNSKHPSGGPDNKQRLEQECGDLLAIVDMMVSNSDLSRERVELYRQSKPESMEPYLHHQKDETK